MYVLPWGGFSAGRLLHYLFLNSLAALVYLFGARGDGEGGACAALLVYITPVVGITGTAAYVDLAGAAYTFGAFYALQQALAGRRYCARRIAVVAVAKAVPVGRAVCGHGQPVDRALVSEELLASGRRS